MEAFEKKYDRKYFKEKIRKPVVKYIRAVNKTLSEDIFKNRFELKLLEIHKGEDYWQGLVAIQLIDNYNQFNNYIVLEDALDSMWHFKTQLYSKINSWIQLCEYGEVHDSPPAISPVWGEYGQDKDVIYTARCNSKTIDVNDPAIRNVLDNISDYSVIKYDDELDKTMSTISMLKKWASTLGLSQPSAIHTIDDSYYLDTLLAKIKVLSVNSNDKNTETIIFAKDKLVEMILFKFNNEWFVGVFQEEPEYFARSKNKILHTYKIDVTNLFNDTENCYLVLNGIKDFIK